MAKLLIYFKPNTGTYYWKYKPIVYEEIPLVTSQGHLLISEFDILVKDIIPFNYRLAYFLERLARILKFGRGRKRMYISRRSRFR